MKRPDFDTLDAKCSNVKGRSPQKSRSVAQEDFSECKPMSKQEHLELVLDRINQAHIDITADEKDWLSILFGISTEFGEAGREYAHSVSQNYVGPHHSYSAEEVNKKYDWCLSHGQGKYTLGTVMAIAKDYGVDVSMPAGRYPEGSTPPPAKRQKEGVAKAGKKVKDETPVTVLAKDFIRANYELRYNTLLQETELRPKGAPTWERISDRIFNTLYTRIKLQGIRINQSDVMSLIQSEEMSEPYNPAMAYFESLEPYDPERDGDPILDFLDHVIVKPEDLEFYHKYGRKWFLNTVALMCGMATDNQLVLNLRGVMNVGKTFFCRNILPPELSSYSYLMMPGSNIDKDHLIAMSSSYLILLDEFVASSRLSNILKAMFSAAKTNIRGAYERYSKTRIRQASFIATGNEMVYISDAAGDRRYPTVEVIGTLNLTEHPLPYAEAFAQAYYLVHQPDYKSHLLPHEVNEIACRNEAHVTPDLCEEAILQCYRMPRLDETGIMVSAADVMTRIQPLYRSNEINLNNIGKAMNKIGFNKKRPGNKTRYYVIEITSAEQYENAKAEGETFHHELNAKMIDDADKDDII